MAEFKIISASISTSITGSIVKVQKLKFEGSVTSGSLINVKFGTVTEPFSEFTSTSDAVRLTLNDGESFECPQGVPCIAGVRTPAAAAGGLGWFVYMLGPSVNTGGTIQSSYDK